MSLNKAINATIALIEGRTDIAKEIFRDPTSDVKDIPAVIARLNRCVDLAAARAIKNALKDTLSVQLDSYSMKELQDKNLPSKVSEAAFYLGVKRVEEKFEQAIRQLELEDED